MPSLSPECSPQKSATYLDSSQPSQLQLQHSSAIVVEPTILSTDLRQSPSPIQMQRNSPRQGEQTRNQQQRSLLASNQQSSLLAPNQQRFPLTPVRTISPSAQVQLPPPRLSKTLTTTHFQNVGQQQQQLLFAATPSQNACRKSVPTTHSSLTPLHPSPTRTQQTIQSEANFRK